MTLSISNIAWTRDQDDAVAALLNENSVRSIDVAPGRYFADPATATTAEVAAVKRWWSDRGVGIAGMQALLFGTTGLNVFDGPESRARMLAHLTGVFRVAEGLGARHLVFGSPKNRDRKDLSDAEVADVSTAFFRTCGDVAARHGVTLCLEPNPAAYGANFMVTAADTAAVVDRVGHPNVRMQFDAGAVRMNDEDPDEVLAAHGNLIGHVHLSEPRLVPLGDGATAHERTREALRRYKPNAVWCVEMLTPADEPGETAIARALAFARRTYATGMENARV